jgi:hypothetical protein
MTTKTNTAVTVLAQSGDICLYKYMGLYVVDQCSKNGGNTLFVEDNEELAWYCYNKAVNK